MSDSTRTETDPCQPMAHSSAVAILTAFVHAANADHQLSTRARFLALDALDALRAEVA